MKNNFKQILSVLPKLVIAITLLTLLITKPSVAALGIKNGIRLLVTSIIPSLFPFLVLSSYIAVTDSFSLLSKFFKRITQSVFKINQNGFIPIVLGLLGGYPVGAKVTADLYKSNQLTKNEAERLMYFTINSGPAFTISYVGVALLNNYYSGLILYASTILTSLTLGFLCRFLSDKKTIESPVKETKNKEFHFVSSVFSGTNALINICAWVLIFSCFTAFINDLNLNSNLSLFISSLLEVTNGCNECVGKVSLPVFSAILGFGGFSVICQVLPYLNACNVPIKSFLASRVLNSAISAFFTSQLINIFPKSIPTGVVLFATNEHSVNLSHTVTTALILVLMCIILIFQVDNRKKMC